MKKTFLWTLIIGSLVSYSLELAVLLGRWFTGQEVPWYSAAASICQMCFYALVGAVAVTKLFEEESK